MSHQPFESWIFSQDPLEIEQKNTLQAHLESCQSCSQLSGALMEMENVFNDSPAISPAPGFTQRWQTRLELARQQRQQKRMWLLTLGLFGGATLTLVALFLLNQPQINLAYHFSQCVVTIARLTSFLNQLWPTFQSLVTNLPILIPIMVIFGTGSLIAVIVLIIAWFSSILKLYQPVQEGVNTR